MKEYIRQKQPFLTLKFLTDFLVFLTQQACFEHEILLVLIRKM